MNVITAITPAPLACSDGGGLPLAGKTLRVLWIITLWANLRNLFSGQDNVLVASNLMWYPDEGDPEKHNATDILVVFGRPAGHRNSYKQWEEEDVPVTVVFEILSPSATPTEIDRK